MSDGNDPNLPVGWARASLEDVVEVLDGTRVPVNAKERAKRHGSIPYYGATGQVGWIDDFLFDETLVLLGEDGAPFFDKNRHVAYLIQGKSWVNNHAHVLRARPGFHPTLLSHQLNIVDYHPFVSGTTRWKLNQAPMRTIPLRIPPAAEQGRMVDVLDEILSDLDAGAASLERVREKLKLYRASMLKAAVEGTLTAEWRARHPDTEPASELLNRILAERRRCWEEDQLAKYKAKKQEPPKNWKAKYKEPVAPSSANLPALPEGWYWASLDQVQWQLRSGTGETSSRKATAFPVLKSSAVRHGTIDFADLNYLSEDQSRHVENFLRERDFLITRLSGSVDYVGCSAVVKDSIYGDIQYPDRIFCSKLVSGIDGTYLTYCFRHTHVRKAIEKAAKSTAGHQRISMSDLRPLLIALPSKDEQDAVVEVVEDQLSIIDHLESDLDSKLKTAQGLRQAILRHAFTGQLVPQDTNDEPASELLKRIAAERQARGAAPPPRARGARRKEAKA